MHYGILKIFGAPSQLSTEEAIGATAQQRIASIWPFTVGKIVEFMRTLTPRERANFSHEDVCDEIVLVLLKKNHRWDPDRGKYITFAGDLIRKELYAIRDRARTVQSPRNTSSRLKGYAQRIAEDGELAASSQKTMNDIKRTLNDSAGINPDIDPGIGDDAETQALAQENQELVHYAILNGMASLTPFEAFVISRLFGLFGAPLKTTKEIAMDRGHTVEFVRQTRTKACAKIRECVESLHLSPLSRVYKECEDPD